MNSIAKIKYSRWDKIFISILFLAFLGIMCTGIIKSTTSSIEYEAFKCGFSMLLSLGIYINACKDQV